MKCNKWKQECPQSCVHSKNHKPIFDRHVTPDNRFVDGLCSEIESCCVYADGITICIEVHNEHS